jgi:hypothetical protein
VVVLGGEVPRRQAAEARTHTGGCGVWTGRGQMLTIGNFWYLPFQVNISRDVHALMIRSWASR